MICVSESGAAREVGAPKPYSGGQTPLRIEPTPAGRFELVQYDLRRTRALVPPRLVLGDYPTEKDAEQAAGRFADGPPKESKPAKPRRPQSMKAKRMNALAVGTAVSKKIRKVG